MPGTKQELARATVSGVAWIYLAFALGKGLVFVSTIILARLLVPADFGLLALGLLAVGILDGLRGLGVGAALIYRKEDPERAASVAFFISLAVGGALTLAVLLGAPLAGSFFQEPRVVPVLRALSVSFLLSALTSVPAALIRKQLAFRRRIVPELGKTAAKGLVSVLLALAGFGVWSLVGGQLAGAAASTLLYWRVCRWRPRLGFDRGIARELLGYGGQIVLIAVLGLVLKNVDYLMIGRRLEASQLGYYTIAFRIPDLFIVSLCAIVSQALFPAFAKLRDDVAALRRGFLAAERYTALITLPVGLGTAIVAPYFVEVFYTIRWAPAIPVMQSLAIYSLLQSLSYNAGDVYKAIGRPGFLNYFGSIRLAVTLPVLWIAAGEGIHWVALGQVAIALAFSAAQLVMVCRLLGVRAAALLNSLRPAAVAAAVMAAATLGLDRVLTLGPAPRLAAISLAGALVYVLTLQLTHPEAIADAVALLRRRKERREDDLEKDLAPDEDSYH